MDYKEETDMYISNIYWDRVFLRIIIQSNCEEKEEIYLCSDKNIHKINLDKIGNNTFEAKINITNINCGEMLENANYTIREKNNNGEYEPISIDTQLAYKLDTLDKIFRYCKENYAYTINFGVIQIEDRKMSCVIKSRYMKINIKHKSLYAKNKETLVAFSMKVLYKIFSLINCNKKNGILLMSETRSPISANLKALEIRLKERGIDKKYKISYSFSKSLQESKLKLFIKWIKLLWVISKQSFVFIDDYSPLFKYINLRKKTKLIQVWHAGVGFKSVGYARFGFGGPEPYNSCHRKYDYAIVGSKALIHVYEEVFGIEREKILPYGLPRLDNFLNEEHISEVKKRIFNKYHELECKKIILFAPTFRGKGQKNATYPYNKLDLDAIFNLCKEKEYIFLIKMHPFIKRKVDIPEEYKTKIKDFSNYPDINELFYITDILITDYSSNIYDFSILNKPIILYAFDLDKYQLINQIQRPVREYAPGAVCENFEEVINIIKQEEFCLEKLKKYREENFDNNERNSCDLIIDNIILKGEKNDKKNINTRG